MTALRVGLATVAFLLLLGLATIALLFSGSGTRLLVGWIDGLGGLELDYGRGSLGGDLLLTRILVPTEDAVVELRELRVQLGLECLPHGEVCLRRLSAVTLDIEVPDTPEPDPDEEPSAFWPLPFRISSDEVNLGLVRVHWEGGEITSSQLSGNVHLQGNTITISQLAALGTRLSSPPGEEPGEPAAALDLPDVDLPVEIALESALLTDTEWSINGISNHYDELEIKAHWTGDRLDIERSMLSHQEWGEAMLRGDVIFRHPYTLNLVGEFTALRPPVWAGLDGASGELRLQGALAALAVQGEVCGRLPVTFRADLDLVDSRWPLSVSAQGSCDGSADPVALAALPGLEGVPEVSLAPGWTLQLTGDWSEQRVALDAMVDGYGLGPVALEARAQHVLGRVTLDSLGASRGDDQQSLQLAGTVNYGDSLVWDLGVDLHEFELPPQLDPLAGQLTGSLQSRGRFNGDSWAVEVSQLAMRGTVAELPATLAGVLYLDQDLDLAGTELDVQLNGAGLRIQQLPVAGLPQAELTVDDLGHWLPAAGGDLQAVMTWDRERRLATIQGSSGGAHWQGLQLGSLALNGSGSLDPQRPVSLVVSSQTIQWADINLQTVTLELRGTLENHRLHLGLEGDVASAMTLDGSLIEGKWRGQLQPMTISSPSGGASLDKAVAVEYLEDEGLLSVAGHCWVGTRRTDLCVDRLRLGESGELSVTLEGDLAALSALLPEQYRVNGRSVGLVSARWVDLELQDLTAQLDIAEGVIEKALISGDWASFNWQDASLLYRGNRDEGRLQGWLRRNGMDQLALDLTMPARTDGGLSGNVALRRFDLATLQPFLTDITTLSGDLVGDLQFSGEVRKPRIHGSIRLSEGSVSPAATATVAENIQLQARFEGQRATIAGELSFGGGISRLQGKMEWDNAPHLALNITGDEKELRFPVETRVFVAEDLLLDVTRERISLSGTVDIPRGHFSLEQLPPEAVEVSADVELFDGEGQALKHDVAAPVDIDLTVRIDERLELVAEGLGGRLGGELKVRRRPGRPLAVFGNINVPEGRFEMLGPRFDVIRGQASFVGVPDNPQLDIALERAISEDQVTVGIRVGGNLSHPQLDFYSRPTLPEEELMAYVLGGRGIDRTGDADSLAIALAMTSGLMQSSGVLKGVSLGVEGKNWKARAALGGYISDRIYLSYGVGLYTPVNTVTVRLDILHNLWMEVISGIQSSADVYYVWSRR